MSDGLGDLEESGRPPVTRDRAHHRRQYRPSQRKQDTSPNNETHWDALADSPGLDAFYDFDAVLAGKSTLWPIEEEELGTIRGLVGAHAQCGFGLETISLARRGARMTGFDFSERVLVRARGLASRAGIAAEFVRANVESLPERMQGGFDFVYTSHGVLRWLSNLEAWATNLASLLKPGGWLYVCEVHPLLFRLERADADGGGFELAGDYFMERPMQKTVQQTHIGTADDLEHRDVLHTDWTLSHVVQAVLDSGLTLEMLSEHSTASYSRKGILNRQQVGWGLASPVPMPLSFSLRARREH